MVTEMNGTKAFALLLLVAVIITQFSPSDAWRRRRRRRCKPPSKPAGYHWANEWDKQMYFECRRGQSVNRFYSIFSACHRDRIWSMACINNPALAFTTRQCHWGHGYANNWDGLLNFHCTHNGFITGVRSKHHNNYEDRLFNFRCCDNSKYEKYRCKTTPFYQNQWRGLLHYQVPSGYYLTGVTSIHNNKKEDRRWQFEICKMRKKSN